MIISRTPFRMSFLGGGTDLPQFYEHEEGAVISTTINKYMHITINSRFDHTFRLSYSRTEIVDRVDQIEHPIFKSVLKKIARAEQGLEVISMADIPSGTGLGSSSSFTVGLLNAINAFYGTSQSAEQLAEEACRIEINELKEPIGKQDQYAAAFGGLRLIRFQPNGAVVTEPVVMKDTFSKEFEKSLMMLYTGKIRNASKVLSVQSQQTDQKRDVLRGMRDLAFNFKKTLESSSDIFKLGQLLHNGWELKRSLNTEISDPETDQLYKKARALGAWGGKILGAGAGGFLLFMADPKDHFRICEALSIYRPMPFAFEKRGSHILFVD